jgi:transcriptional regulator GlxA family with amidase domain
MAPIVIGSLCYHYLAIDVIAPFDTILSSTKPFMEGMKLYTPTITDSIIANAPEFVFQHIGLSLDPVDLTAGLTIKPTCTVDDSPELDAEFIRKHVASGKALFTNCTGSFVAAITGVLDGKNATGNHLEYEWVKHNYPKVKWTKEKKWVVDGNIWTAAGPMSGVDMILHWMRENYGEEVFNFAAMNLDYEPRDADGVNVIPFRYGEDGKRLYTHVHRYYDSY